MTMSSTESKKYDNRRALVTGAASGIGKSLTEYLINNGAVVVCCDINEEGGRSMVAKLNKGLASPVAFFVKADVTSWDDVVSMFEEAEKLLKSKLDFVFPNAGVLAPGYLSAEGKPDLSPIVVNLSGVIYTVKAAIDHFRSHKSGGRIVVTASLASIKPFPREPIYAASKSGVLGFIRSTAPALEHENIYLNAVGPSLIITPLLPEDIVDEINRYGLATSMEAVIKAFTIFLEPDCTLSGELAEALGDNAYLHRYTAPNPKAHWDEETQSWKFLLKYA